MNPNPTGTVGRIELSAEPLSRVEIQVVDLMGRVVSSSMERANEHGRLSISKDVSTLTSGPYLVVAKVEGSNELLTTTLLVAH